MRKIQNLLSLAFLTLAACNPFLPAARVGGACTGTAIFTWDAPLNSSNSIDQSVTGYNLYSGFSSRNYDLVNNANIGSLTPTITYSQGGFNIGPTYFFAVTAYNPGGESGYSNEVSKTFSQCGETVYINLGSVKK